MTFDFLTQATKPPKCSRTDCNEESVYNLLCGPHYKESRAEIKKAKEVERRKTQLQKLFDNASVKDDGCIVPAQKRVTVKGIRLIAYRYVYEHVTGDYLDEGFAIHHLCLNNNCINPSHLKKVTKAEHMQFHRIVRDPINGRILRVEHHSH